MRCSWVAVLLAAAGCGGLRERPGAAEARLYYYADDQGLSVTTAGAAVSQPVARGLAVSLQGLADRIVVERPETVVTDSAGQPTGHSHDEVDAVSSASVTVTGGDRLDKTRFEGIGSVLMERSVADTPVRVQGSFRLSSETDYTSYGGRVRAGAELFERNTTVSAFAGYGHDDIDPVQAPPGEAELWPASHARWSVGASVTQLLTPALVVSGGFGLNHQFGTLANPYRRARVVTTLFPERLPDERDRVTVFAGLSWYLGADTALHLRPGAYVDSWGVKAFIPQIALARELTPEALLTLYYRAYWQGAADFYAARYPALLEIRTGDARLGRVRAHHPGFELLYTVLGRRDDFGSLTLGCAWAASFIEYPELEIGGSVLAQVVSVLVNGSY